MREPGSGPAHRRISPTGFFPERAEGVAGLLYDSLFDKLLPLGDHVIIYPAHGAGPVCGRNMAERDLSTIGYERRHSLALQQADRETFARPKTAESHYYPPWFRKMEEYNLRGAPALHDLPQPQPLDANEFAAAIADGHLAGATDIYPGHPPPAPR